MFKKTISIVVGICVFAVAFLIYQGTQKEDMPRTFDPNYEVSTIVRQINISEKLGIKDSAAKEQLENALVARKDRLLAEVKKNPKFLAENRLSEETREGIPPELLDLVEKDTQLEGKFISAVLDYKDGRHDNVYALKSAGVNYHIYFAEPPKNVLKTAEKATINGLELGNTVVLASSGSENLVSESWGYDPLNEFGEQKTLVLMMNFTNNTATPFSSSSVVDQIVNNSNSTDKYYREVSYYSSAPATGIYFSAVARGYYTVPFNSATTACDVVDNENWADAADQMAMSDGVNLAAYNRKAYLFPNVNPCGWAGLAYVGGDHSWYNGYNDSMLWSHELGHNLGEGHASTRDCGAATIDVYANCSESEYGDNYDTMGNWNLYHVNAAHKVNDGWIPPARVIDTSTGGTFTISPIETYTTNPQVLRIRKPNTSDYYYFEYRQPVGFDSTLPTGLTRGATAQLWDNVFWDNTYAIDFTPADGFNDIAMADGQTFTDTINGISVTQVSHGATLTLTVEITKHMIEASTGVYGSISPPGNTLIDNGDSQTFTMVPDSGYRANEVFIDGVSIGRVNSYTFTNVTADHTIYATFSYQPTLHHFSMTGHAGNKTAGQPFDMTLTAYDQTWGVFNDYAGIVTVTSNDPNATLPVDNGQGWQNGQKVFTITLTKAPSANVIFTDGSVSAGNGVTVLPAALNHISLSPSTAQVITTPNNVAFSAHGYDMYDNSVTGPSYIWSGTNYSESGFIGDCKTPGVYQVHASSGGINSPNVQVTINAGPASSVTISSAVATLIAGQTSQLTAVARDVCSTVVSTPALTWTNADAGGLFSNTSAGNHVVSATSGSIQSNNVYLRVDPGAIDHVNISPSTAQVITAGTNIFFVSSPRDPYNNMLPSNQCTWTGTNQESFGIFVKNLVGTYSVKATCAGVESSTVTVSVIPGSLYSINISPSINQTVNIGESINFSAQGNDMFGNSIAGLSYGWVGVDVSGTFLKDTPGVYQVLAISGGIESPVVNITVLGPQPVSFGCRAHVQNIGWQEWVEGTETCGTTGQSLRVEAIQFSLINAPTGMSIRYRSHVQGIGWQPWIMEGAISGTTGQSLRLEAVQVELVNAPLGTVAQCRAHVQNVGWQEWVNDVGTCGTTGQSLRVEAVELRLADATVSKSIQYRGHVQYIGWQPWVSDGATAGTTGQSLRVEALQVRLVGAPPGVSIQCRAHVQNIGWMGWVNDTETCGTTGQSLRVEAIQLRLVNAPVGMSIQYRGHVQYIGWQPWVSDGATAGTTGQSLRVEALQVRLVQY